jgi:hypothetical protein
VREPTGWPSSIYRSINAFSSARARSSIMFLFYSPRPYNRLVFLWAR